MSRRHRVNILCIENGRRATYSSVGFARLQSTGCDGQLEITAMVPLSSLITFSVST
jgi:hypothetical protein